MWTWHCHSADPVRGARAQSVRQRRSLDAGYGTDPHPSSVELPYGRGGLRERRPSALARQKVRMPRSSRGCSFVRCVKGRPGPYAERTMAGSRSSPKKMDTRPRRCGRPTHTRCESFAAGGADSSLIGDWRGASRASAAIARSAGLRSCALGTADEIHRTVTGQTSVSFDWRGSATVIRYGLTSAYGQSSTGVTARACPRAVAPGCCSPAGPHRPARPRTRSAAARAGT